MSPGSPLEHKVVRKPAVTCVKGIQKDPKGSKGAVEWDEKIIEHLKHAGKCQTRIYHFKLETSARMFSCQNGCKTVSHLSWCDARNCRTSGEPNSPSSRTRPAHPYWSTCKNTSPLACCWLLSQTIGSFPQSNNSKILPCWKVCTKQLSTNTKECKSSQKQSANY